MSDSYFPDQKRYCGDEHGCTVTDLSLLQRIEAQLGRVIALQ